LNKLNKAKENFYSLALAMYQRIVDMHNGYITLNIKNFIDNSLEQSDVLGAHVVSGYSRKICSYHMYFGQEQEQELNCLSTYH
jgi:hypothetical protein